MHDGGCILVSNQKGSLVITVNNLGIRKTLENQGFPRAIDGARTRGLDLGKVARYQLRHYRMVVHFGLYYITRLIRFCQLFCKKEKQKFLLKSFAKAGYGSRTRLFSLGS